jgi:tetratricopeptide (TPR) repeat protein
MSSSEVCIESGHTLATALLLSEKFNDALQVVQEAGKFNRDTFNFNVSALHGLIVLRQGDEITARQAFTRAIAQADDILAKTPDYYEALDAKGLALCGLALTVGADLRVRPGQTHQSAPTEINNAIETFRQARKIAPHAGIVKATLRLFDELVKCDEAGVLKNVRAAVEGKK